MKALVVACGLIASLNVGAEEPRFQVVQVTNGGSVLLDTRTGATWALCRKDAAPNVSMWCVMEYEGGQPEAIAKALDAMQKQSKAAK